MRACSRRREGARQRATLAQPQFAVADRIFDDIAHAAHARVDRRAPRRREHVDGRLLAAARAGWRRRGSEKMASPTHDGATSRMGSAMVSGPGAIVAPPAHDRDDESSQCPPRGGAPFSWYRVPQYGHIASPVAATSRKTRGWLDHSGIAGFGQYSGRSAAVTSTRTLRSGCIAAHRLWLRPAVSQDLYLAFLPCTASKNRALQLLGDRAALAGADRAIVELADRRHLGGGAGEERLVGDVDVVARQALGAHLVARGRAPASITESRVMPVSAEVSSGS